MGQQIELGELYDATSGLFYGGFSLWNSSDLAGNKTRIYPKPDTSFKVSIGTEEVRSNSSLDLNGSVEVDFKIIAVSGNAKYLQSSGNARNQARVDLTCTRTNRVRKVAMENLTAMPHREMITRQSNITHFVAEVVEGATANITFKKDCKNDFELKEVAGNLAGKLRSSFITTSVSGGGSSKFEDASSSEQFDISVSGPLTGSFTSYEEVMKVAKDIPKELEKYNNTLMVKLLPIQLIEPKQQKNIEKPLDDNFLQQLLVALRKAENLLYDIDSMNEFEDVKLIPSIHEQHQNFRNSFESCIDKYRSFVKELLPKIRSGQEDPKALDEKRSRMDAQSQICEKFVKLKKREAEYLDSLFKDMNENGMKNCMKMQAKEYWKDQKVFNMCLAALTSERHPLEDEMMKATPNRDIDASGHHWYDDPEKRKAIGAGIEQIKANKVNETVSFDVRKSAQNSVYEIFDHGLFK